MNIEKIIAEHVKDLETFDQYRGLYGVEGDTIEEIIDNFNVDTLEENASYEQGFLNGLRHVQYRYKVR